MKQPRIWWDMEWKGTTVHAIIVESDDPKYPIIKRYLIRGDAHCQIELAERLIKDIKEGRLSMKDVVSG